MGLRLAGRVFWTFWPVCFPRQLFARQPRERPGVLGLPEACALGHREEQGWEPRRAFVQTSSPSLGRATSLYTPTTRPCLWTGEFPAPETQGMDPVLPEATGGPTAPGPSFRPTQTPDTCQDSGVQSGEWDEGVLLRGPCRGLTTRRSGAGAAPPSEGVTPSADSAVLSLIFDC